MAMAQSTNRPANTQPTVSYESIRSQLDTGDLIFFSGLSRASRSIQWVTRSRWSHIGLVVRFTEWDQVVLWESTPVNDVKDVFSGRETVGVQCVFLSERLKRFPGGAALRQLRVQRTQQMLEALRDFRADMRGRPYETSTIELALAAYDGPFGRNEEDLSSIFCSELVAEAYQRMGLLDPGMAANEYTPADFSERRTRGIQLLQGELGPEISLQRGRSPEGLQEPAQRRHDLTSSAAGHAISPLEPDARA